MSAIFISHSSTDNGHAAEMRRVLRDWGYQRLFLDFDPEDGIPAGRSWLTELYDKLRACQAVVVLCSEHSMRSMWCFAEITQALARGKSVFPVKISDCELHQILRTPQVVDLVAEPEAGWDRLRRGLEGIKLGARPFVWDSKRDLYRGLPSFERGDAAIYFGREEEVAELREMLRRINDFGGRRFILLLGASGSGKSSLLRAGLIPWLDHERRPWIVVGPFQPGRDPWTAFRDALISGIGEPATVIPTLAEVRRMPVEEVAESVIHVCEDAIEAHGQENGSVLLAIDQLEELLEGESVGLPGGSSRLLADVLRSATSERSPLIVVATLRSDFLPDLQNDAGWGTFPAEQFSIGPISREDLARCIEGPADLADIELKPGLVQALIEDTGGSDALPLLSYTLRELWLGYADDRDLTVDEYRVQLGGMQEAINKGAESVYLEARDAGVSGDDIRSAFLSMTRMVDEGRYDRRARPWGNFPPQIQGVLNRFVEKRLLRTRSDSDIRVVEPSHRTLFSSWKRAESWVDEGHEALLWQRRLEFATRDWLAGGRTDDGLWRGEVLAAYTSQAANQAAAPSPDEKQFLQRSASQDRRGKITRRALEVGVPLTVGAAMLFGVLVWQRSLQQERIRSISLLEAGEVPLLISAEREGTPVEQLLDAAEVFLGFSAPWRERVVGLGATAWILDYVDQGWAEHRGRVARLRESLTAELESEPGSPRLEGFEWIEVPGGTFVMGDTAQDGSSPEHRVSVSPFRILKHEVTRDQISDFLPEYVRSPGEPNAQANGRRAASQMTWAEAYAYAAWLGGRLPTEAEWEYAATFGCAWTQCDSEGNLIPADEVGWYQRNYPSDIPHAGRMPMPIGQKAPNPLGLHDILGNVWEWVADWYDYDYPADDLSEARIDPWGPVTGAVRVIRGGGYWDDGPAHPASRYFQGAQTTNSGVGLRVVWPDTVEVGS